MIKIGCDDRATLKTSLFDILSSLDQNHHTLKWRVSEFYGTAKHRDGRIFGELNIRDFEEKTSHGQCLEFSWEEILSVADKIFQTFDIELIGISEAGDRREVIINCFDSTYWTIEICNPLQAEADMVKTLRALHPQDLFT